MFVHSAECSPNQFTFTCAVYDEAVGLLYIFRIASPLSLTSCPQSFTILNVIFPLPLGVGVGVGSTGVSGISPPGVSPPPPGSSPPPLGVSPPPDGVGVGVISGSGSGSNSVGLYDSIFPTYIVKLPDLCSVPPAY